VAEELTIGAVARRAKVRASAIRYYESADLLPSPVRVNGQRRYDASVLDRLAIIGIAQQAGFTIAEIQVLLHGFSAEVPPSERWRALCEQKLPDVEALIARALGMKRVLEEAFRCECLTFEDCMRLIRSSARDEPACQS
jgi:MerR family transcriptional regulator, redox-sensitive transcriptional activator SoxR